MFGYRRKTYHVFGMDPLAIPSRESPRHKYTQNNFRLRSGYISDVQEEPESEVVLVTVRMITGEEVSPVMYPGPAVTVNMSGRYGGNIAGVHGIYVPPAIGQKVVIGYLEGKTAMPVVLSMDSYRSRVDFGDPTLHTLPLTKQGHSAKDLVFGHWTGSYFVIRARLPLPGQIETYSRSKQVHEAKAGFEYETQGQYVIKASQFKVELTTGEELELSPAQFKVKFPSGNELTLDVAKMEVTTSGITHRMNTVGVSTDGQFTWDANSIPTRSRTHTHPSAAIGPPSPPTPGS